MKYIESMNEKYYAHLAEREARGIPPLPLSVSYTNELVSLLKNPPKEQEEEFLNLLINRVPPGVDEAAKIKAEFLDKISKGQITSPVISRLKAVEILGSMQGGYNIQPLIEALDIEELAELAVKQLSHTLLIFDGFEAIKEKAQQGNLYAQKVIQKWADAEWFTHNKEVSEKLTMKVFKVSGEINTDDLSPAQEAWCRSDIPLHALSMLKMSRTDNVPDKEGEIGPVSLLNKLKEEGYPLVFVGDVVGTGSSRKSATNSVLWHIGEDIPFVPNKRRGGIVLAGKIAPIFFNTMEDSGALPIEDVDVSQLNTGDVIDIYPYAGEIRKHSTNELITKFEIKNPVLFDEVRAGGRISLIIGRKLTAKAREFLNLPVNDVFRKNIQIPASNRGYSLAQKIVGKACGVTGIRPGEYCEPKISSVGSQDTTGSMTRDELKDLACLKFSADLVMQSFCHTAAYPKLADIKLQQTLPQFFIEREGIVLRPGDGIIHSWLNRMIIPDTVGTGGDSHTRFPMGISFPGGSGLVAFAAATGVIPLDMPESVLVRFTGTRQEGITLRDLVHAIPYYATKEGLLTIDKKGKKNVFSGRILEIEGLSDLTMEQAFELADASAERSAAACTIELEENKVKEYIESNIALLKWMITEGYECSKTIEKRIQQMEEWLSKPELLKADKDAEYAAILTIDMNEIKEPILCVPNDPDDARLLSEINEGTIDEVFIGSCMTNIGHFRAASEIIKQSKKELKSKLWISPPTRMDQKELKEEGLYNTFCSAGTRIEIPGCSLCMGNQARVKEGTNVISTSTRNFPNRLGTNARVYLASAELAAVSSLLGRLPSIDEYTTHIKVLSENEKKIYKYLDFSTMSDYYTDLKN